MTKKKSITQIKTITINEIKLVKHEPLKIFKNGKNIKNALLEAVQDGDKEAIIDILSGYVRAKTVAQISHQTGLTHSVINRAIRENGNPKLDILCKIIATI